MIKFWRKQTCILVPSWYLELPVHNITLFVFELKQFKIEPLKVCNKNEQKLQTKLECNHLYERKVHGLVYIGSAVQLNSL